MCLWLLGLDLLTHWGRVTHICVSKLTIIGPDNGLSPGRYQAIIWTNAGILLIGPLGTNFSEILIKIYTFSFKKMLLKLSSAKWRPFCLGLSVLSSKISYHQISQNLKAMRCVCDCLIILKFDRHSCRGACQISEWYHNFNTHSHGFKS